MTTNRRRRADLDGDEDLPAFVTEKTAPEKPIPRCMHCGAECPRARELHTLCEACINRGIPFGLTEPMPATSAKDLIRKLADRLPEAPRMPQPAAKTVTDRRAERHVERLTARGLSRGAARAQAEAMVADEWHVKFCELCQSVGA
jgi:hypothetical protein